MLVAIAVTASGCGSSSDSSSDGDGTIKVGQNLALSGFQSFFGQSKRIGAAVAVAKINAQGGVEVDGEQREFELLVEDNRTNPTTAISAAEKLADEEVILSNTPEEGFEGVYQLYNGADVISLGAGGPTSAALSEDPEANPLLFNEFPLFDAFLGGHLQQIKYLYPEAKTFAALLPDDPNGQGFLPLFQQLAPEYGFEFVGAEFHPPDETGDFTPYLTALKEKQPDVLYTGLFPQQSIPATEQAAELDAADILTADFLLPQDVAGIDLRDHPLVLTQQTQVFGEDFVPKGTEDLVQRLEEEAEGDDFVASLAVNAYVDLWLLKDAIERLGPTTRPRLRKRCFRRPMTDRSGRERSPMTTRLICRLMRSISTGTRPSSIPSLRSSRPDPQDARLCPWPSSERWQAIWMRSRATDRYLSEYVESRQ